MLLRDSVIIPTCRHILENGAFCMAAAVTGRTYCRAHLVSRLRLRKMARSQRRTGGLKLLPLDTTQDVRNSITRTQLALEAGQLDQATAKVLLWAMRMAGTVARQINRQEIAERSRSERNPNQLYRIPAIPEIPKTYRQNDS